jgi:hypothetical protein
MCSVFLVSFVSTVIFTNLSLCSSLQLNILCFNYHVMVLFKKFVFFNSIIDNWSSAHISPTIHCNLVWFVFIMTIVCCCPLHSSPNPYKGEAQYPSFDAASPVVILFTEMNINLILRNELPFLFGYKWQFLEP